MKTMLLLAGTVAALATACRTVELPSPQPVARLGDTARVTLGETLEVPDAKLRITFTGVAADSRCSPNVVCVWAGSVRVRLTVTDAAGAPAAVELESNIDPRVARVGDYNIQLLPEVQPAKDAPGPYIIALRVSPT